MTNKCQRIPKGQYKMDNPEKLETQGTQDTGLINVREYRRGNKKMDNPEKLETYGTPQEFCFSAKKIVYICI